MFVEPVVHELAGDLVVVVAEFGPAFGFYQIGFVIDSVELFEFGLSFLFDGHSPVVGARKAHGPGREHSGKLDITGTHAQP